MSKKRVRRIGSVKVELLKKSNEAALSAIQVFNNPNIRFKSETFIVLTVIAWTYLLHAYYRQQKIEYRYFERTPSGSRRFIRTEDGAYRHWDLSKCLDAKECPLKPDTVLNLRFLLGLRNEIEHRMTNRLDDYLSARYQAACINYNEAIKDLFGDAYAIASHLTYCLQLSALSDGQVAQFSKAEGLAPNIRSYIERFDAELSEDDFNSPRFAYRVIFVPKLVNHKGQADHVVEFVRADSELAKSLNTEYAVIKETERAKFRPMSIVTMMRDEGFPRFNMHHHTLLWKQLDGKNSAKGFGVEIQGQWYWYERWVDVVRNHCRSNGASYT